jgi:molybdopterin converting factor small subunit
MAPTSAAEVAVQLPSSFDEFTGGRRRIELRGSTVGDVLAALEARYPALRPHLRDEAGRLRPFTLVFLNFEDIRSKQGEQTPVSDGDLLAIVPAADGG